ncbi:MAG: DUF2232 domain-containing protein, partial [Holophagae bacterium]
LFVIPFLGLLVAPLGSLPILHFQSTGTPGYRAWGPVVALLAVAAVGGFATIALPLLAAYGLLVVLPSVSVDVWVRAQWAEGRWVAVATSAGLLATLAVVFLLASPQTPMDAIAGWMRASAEDMAELYAAWGLSQGNAELVLDAAERAASWVLPSVPVAYLVLVLFWMRPRLPLLGLPVAVGEFEAYHNDEWLAAAFVLGGGGTLLLSGIPRWVAINLLVAVLILYFVQGLAMIRAHLARWFGRGWLVRWGVALLCLQGPMPLLVAALGVADSFHPLRPQVDDDGGKNEGDS